MRRISKIGSSPDRCPVCGHELSSPEVEAHAARQPLVLLEGVEKTYRQGRISVDALQGVTLALPSDRMVAIVGPSGSGKSTLLNLLGALDTPTSGRIHFESQDITALSERERTRFRSKNIGFIFQFFNLLPGLTCAQNVALAGVIAGMGPRAARAKAVELLGLVGLEDKTATSARDLSGGQMQRVAIARALVNEPRLVLADEPTGNLDHTNAEEIMRVLSERATGGRTIVLVTHNEELAERYADEVVFLLDGQVVDGRRVGEGGMRAAGGASSAGAEQAPLQAAAEPASPRQTAAEPASSLTTTEPAAPQTASEPTSSPSPVEPTPPETAAKSASPSTTTEPAAPQTAAEPTPSPAEPASPPDTTARVERAAQAREEPVARLDIEPTGGIVELDVGPFPEFDSLVRFQHAIANVDGLEAVCLERFEAQRAVFSIRIDRPAALLAQLAQFAGRGATVREVERDRLVLDLRES